ncbi:TonB-dependent receptor [Sphingobium sp. TKS]|uniref:TonB-dependent receptor n=1 Tax=Sphingobium sp. TKS TaxID=1315974 RepID=UPI0007701373|nr:TonB-dependent receptor [Sphingobium sp. TKS]AMK21565.1 putative TonB-dependent siderophore receptor [Sphingobium sp. TKS]
MKRPDMTYAITLGLLALSSPALADNEPEENRLVANFRPTPGDEILVIGQKHNDRIENAPSTRVSIDESRINATVNAASVEDTIKYLPSLVVRKRHIGDNFAPIATRTSGLGASARSLIYADGAPLSALIANNNGSGSPRWNMVTPEEISRIDVLYGPFSAAYPGNSIGTVVNIVTRMPDALEARLSVLSNLQRFDQYATSRTLPTWQVAGSIGDRFGPLALFASATHTTANSQPLAYITAASAPAGATGAFDDRNRTGTPIKVLGGGGIEHHLQDNFKLKAALELSPDVRITYIFGLWRDDSRGTVKSYLSDVTGAPVYTSAFSPNVYTRDALHWSHVATVHGEGDHFDWHLVGTVYRYGHDIQRTPGGALPAAFSGGGGNVQRQDGTGWTTFDAKAAWRSSDGAHVLGFGGHYDRYRVEADRYTTADWTGDQQGALNQSSRGKTRMLALWVQDAWTIRPGLTLTLGGRHEWWRAYEGYNFSATPALVVNQPERAAQGFSPKATLEWQPRAGWSAKLSFGQAYRFPTVGELYQTVTTGTVLSVPNPDLKPERARSAELALEHRDARGTLRLSLFNEVVDNALIAQSGPLPPITGTFSFVQNVDRTRARGIEVAVNHRDIVPGIDLSGSVTYTDARTVRDAIFPAAVGKLLPSVPHWKASAVVTWHASKAISLATAVRYASRNYATLDNSDSVGNTYQGFYRYFVVDARALFQVSEHLEFAVGVDNLNNDKYFLFHPFPQRSFTIEATWKL